MVISLRKITKSPQVSKLLSVISEYCQSFLNKTLLKADYLQQALSVREELSVKDTKSKVNLGL